ncbi:hypothetical protein QWY77_04240 [Thalassotalea ponticola]|uniref:hypothetical protein n=1 Tax=Thalassotalea ponticola TaxID=1523392 RepID=UPI0025B5ADF1|nr:hypothetical protein [Thalassotalea ponticola]MDN3651976.1 hypothetical protein [Thalassotalea ponticola]
MSSRKILFSSAVSYLLLMSCSESSAPLSIVGTSISWNSEYNICVLEVAVNNSSKHTIDFGTVLKWYDERDIPNTYGNINGYLQPGEEKTSSIRISRVFGSMTEDKCNTDHLHDGYVFEVVQCSVDGISAPDCLDKYMSFKLRT